MHLTALTLLDPTAAPPAPGRAVEGAPAPAPAPGGGSPPPGGGGGGGGILMMLLVFLPVFLLLFFMNRSQGKKQKELESKLKKGDRVITQSGLVGKLVDLGDKRIKVEIAPGVKVEMLKTAIAGIDTEGAAKPAAATGGDKK